LYWKQAASNALALTQHALCQYYEARNCGDDVVDGHGGTTCDNGSKKSARSERTEDADALETDFSASFLERAQTRDTARSTDGAVVVLGECADCGEGDIGAYIETNDANHSDEGEAEFAFVPVLEGHDGGGAGEQGESAAMTTNDEEGKMPKETQWLTINVKAPMPLDYEKDLITLDDTSSAPKQPVLGDHASQEYEERFSDTDEPGSPKAIKAQELFQGRYMRCCGQDTVEISAQCECALMAMSDDMRDAFCDVCCSLMGFVGGINRQMKTVAGCNSSLCKEWRAHQKTLGKNVRLGKNKRSTTTVNVECGTGFNSSQQQHSGMKRKRSGLEDSWI
jgi:hypothetical protein